MAINISLNKESVKRFLILEKKKVFLFLVFLIIFTQSGFISSCCFSFHDLFPSNLLETFFPRDFYQNQIEQFDRLVFRSLRIESFRLLMPLTTLFIQIPVILIHLAIFLIYTLTFRPIFNLFGRGWAEGLWEYTVPIWITLIWIPIASYLLACFLVFVLDKFRK